MAILLSLNINVCYKYTYYGIVLWFLCLKSETKRKCVDLKNYCCSYRDTACMENKLYTVVRRTRKFIRRFI